MRQKPSFRKSQWLMVGFICLIPIVGWVLTVSGTGSVGKDKQTFLPFIVQLTGDQAIATPTPTATQTVTPTPTATPKSSVPFVEVIPNCGSPPQVTFNVVGSNWPTTESIFLYWYDPAVGDTFLQTIAAPHSGSFSVNWTRTVTKNREYLVKAGSNSYPFPSNPLEAAFTVPCPGATPTPLATATSTATLTATYTPSTTPTATIDLGPSPTATPTTTPGPSATSTSTGTPTASPTTTHTATSTPTSTPTPTPTPSAADLIVVEPPHLLSTQPVPGHHPMDFQIAMTNTSQTAVNELFFVDLFFNPSAVTTTSIPITDSNGYAGFTYFAANSSQIVTVTAYVILINENSQSPAQTAETDSNGYYEFSDLPASDSYTIKACLRLDGIDYVGLRSGIVPPDPFTDIYMLEGNCP